jgi:hypothetical protein
VVRQINNQMLTREPAHEWKHARMILKEHLLKARQIFAHVGNPPKKLTTWGETKPRGFQKVGFEGRQPRVERVLSRTCKIMKTKVKRKV